MVKRCLIGRCLEEVSDEGITLFGIEDPNPIIERLVQIGAEKHTISWISCPICVIEVLILVPHPHFVADEPVLSVSGAQMSYLSSRGMRCETT